MRIDFIIIEAILEKQPHPRRGAAVLRCLGEGGLYPQRVAESELEETESRRSAEKAALYYDSGTLLSV